MHLIIVKFSTILLATHCNQEIHILHFGDFLELFVIFIFSVPLGSPVIRILLVDLLICPLILWPIFYISLFLHYFLGDISIISYFLFHFCYHVSIGLSQNFLQFENKTKRHNFHFHKECYWTMYSPFCFTTFCHFPGNFHNSIFPKFFIFLSKELFQVPFTVFQRIKIFSVKKIL